MAKQLIPDTGVPLREESGMFARFVPLIRATNGLTLSQVCAITSLEPSTIQNWVKRGFVANPVNKKYHERQLARILLISALRDAMKIDSIGELMRMVNGSANDESDDIIPEDRLYDYFCETVARAERTVPAMEDVAALVAQTISDYEEPVKGAKTRLANALGVMVCAFACAKYKQEAERLFAAMKSACGAEIGEES